MFELKEKISKAIYEALMYAKDTRYPIGQGMYISFCDKNEWGDEAILLKGVKLEKLFYHDYFETEEVVWDKEFLLKDFTGGVEGSLIFHGQSCIDMMRDAIMCHIIDKDREEEEAEMWREYA